MPQKTYGPLPGACNFGAGGPPRGHIALLFSSAKVSQISATNADVCDPGDGYSHDKNVATIFQLFLHLTVKTFMACHEGGGGAMFFTRVDKATRDRRLANPFSPLVGPHQMDFFVLFTKNQANEFMKFFTEHINPEERRRKRQKTDPHHELSYKAVTNFPEFVRRSGNYHNLRYRSHGGGQLDEANCCLIPGEDESIWEEFDHATPLHHARRAHPFHLYKAEHVIEALRQTRSLAEYDYAEGDFLTYVKHGIDDGDGDGMEAAGDYADDNHLRLVPSERIVKAGLVRYFSPSDLFIYFSGTFGPDADKFLGQAPWFSEPSPQQIKDAVERSSQSHGYTSTFKRPEDAGVFEDSEFYCDYYRLSLYDQAFTEKQKGFCDLAFVKKGHHFPIDPSRTNPIPVEVPSAGGETGESQLRKRYPVLSMLVEKNTQVMLNAKNTGPENALLSLRHIARQAFSIVRAGNADSITPTFHELVRQLDHISREISGSGPADLARYKKAIFPHDPRQMLFEHVADGEIRHYSPAAWSQLFFVSNCSSHIGVTPTQMSMAILCDARSRSLLRPCPPSPVVSDTSWLHRTHLPGLPVGPLLLTRFHSQVLFRFLQDRVPQDGQDCDCIFWRFGNWQELGHTVGGQVCHSTACGAGRLPD